ncbi:C25 family cysteine peptidase [Streptomyces sp. WMMC1477]|uniref:C25 family cysteine peptidase n=1 Tax=Streptomyces sp. WMMC1477 TaxID=3015155 RepID=UPI0022B7439F|nr:C25 family cysteine peptidase [Streptomyces sp. WMMC1477]MCZ7430965.1 C25 family cysteine peptidase [Streptomyces sp. WMMC1477]
MTTSPKPPHAGTPSADATGAPQLRTDSLDDYGPMVALAIRRPDVVPLPYLRAHHSPLPDPPGAVTMHDFLARADDETLGLWRHFQRLWHRWAAPLDSFHPVRWYLTACATGPHRSVHTTVDGWLQRLATQTDGQVEATAVLLGLEPEDGDLGAVLGWGAPEWSLPAMLLAARTGRPFRWVPDAAQARREAERWPGTLTLAFPHDEIGVEDLPALTLSRSYHAAGRLADGLELASRPVGFLTATSLQVLSSVTSRRLALPGPLPPTSAAVFTGLDADPDVGPDSFLLNRERSAAGYLEAVGEVSALFLSGHSREDLFHLGPDALCGRSLQPAPSGPETRLPACVLDGDCVKGGEVLPAHTLSAPVAFFNSCNVMRLGGDGAFDEHFTLPFTYQEGEGVALVGSRRTRFGDDNVELVLAERLVRTGRPMGEIVRTLNNAIPLWGREAPDYLLLGDPEFRPFPPGPDAAEVAVRPGAEGGGVEVEFSGVDAELLEVLLPDPGPAPSVRVTGITAADGESDEVDLRTALVREEDGGVRLFVFSWKALRLRRLALRVDPGRPHQELSDDVARTLGNASAYRRLLRGYLGGFDNAEQELRSKATALSRRRAEARTAPLALREADTAAGELRSGLSRLDEALCTHLLDRIAAGAFVWLEQCESADGNFHVARHLPPTTCPYCAARVVLREYRNDHHPQASREFALCASCGNIWDVPGAVPPPVVLGADTARRGGEHRQGVRVTNDADRPLYGAVGMRLYQADQHGVTVTPGVREVAVPPRSSREFWFTLKLPEGVPAHMEFLRGFLVSNLDVAMFQRNLWTRPAEEDATAPEAEADSAVPPVWPPSGTVVSSVVRGRGR